MLDFVLNQYESWMAAGDELFMHEFAKPGGIMHPTTVAQRAHMRELATLGMIPSDPAGRSLASGTTTPHPDSLLPNLNNQDMNGVEGRLEWQMSLVTGIVSVLQVCVYIYLMFGKTLWARCVSWEVIIVVAVESAGYLLNCAMRSEGIVPETQLNITGKNDDPRYINFFRMGSWFITCPVLLYFVVRVVNPAPTNRQIIQSIMILQLCFVSGVGSALGQDKGIRIMLFIFGCTFLLLLYNAIWAAYSEYKSDLPPQIAMVLYYMFIAWAVFPIIFGIGDDLGKFLSFATTGTLYAAGDLLSKNLFSATCVWYLSIYLEERDRKGILSSQQILTLKNANQMEKKEFQQRLTSNVLILQEQQRKMMECFATNVDPVAAETKNDLKMNTQFNALRSNSNLEK